MRLPLILLATALLAPATLYGCSKPAPGQSQNLPVMGVGYKGQGLAHRVKEDVRDTTDALNITPRVKGAIIADSQLNNPRNHINVNTKDYVLHLKGHVYSAALKSRAGRIAARKLSKMHKNYKISNELAISPR